MIKYVLRCDFDHEFESWFSDSAAYEELESRGLLSCPYCGDSAVRRAVMAPNIGFSGAADDKAAVQDQAGEAEADPPAGALPAKATTPALSPTSTPEVMMRTVMRHLQRQIEKEFDYVGKNFAKEARRMDKGEREGPGIYGEASAEEVDELAEEGIDVLPMPKIQDDA